MHTNCPHCTASYRVRIEAAGRQARCRTCQSDFVIPPPRELLEDTILAWLAEAAEPEEEHAEP